MHCAMHRYFMREKRRPPGRYRRARSSASECGRIGMLLPATVTRVAVLRDTALGSETSEPLAASVGDRQRTICES